MEPADDNKSANPGNTLKLDLSTLKDRHELVRNEAFQDGTNATESAKGPTVELLKHVVAPESNRTEAGGVDLYQLPNNTGVAAVSAAINPASTNNAENNSGTNDNTRRSSNSALCIAGNISSSRSLNPPDKSKRQITEIVPPNSSPARLEGLPRKGALSPFQKNDPRTTARGASPGGLNDKKASSFSAPTNSPVKSRVARGVLAVDNTGTGTASITSEKALNVQRVAEYDGRAEKVVGAGSTSSSGSTAHQTERGKGRCEEAHWMQQEVLKDKSCSQTSDESVEDEDDEGQSESGESDSCDADCQNTSPSERHLEREDEWQREDATEACPAVLETELDGPEEEEHLDIGELRYNMRTGKFSKAYVVRGVSGHRTLLKQRRAIVGGEKGPESSWIFPWEVRPEIDVFAAAAAATAASSARRHQLLPSRRVGSAPADTNSHNYTSYPGRPCGKPYADGLYRRKQRHATHFRGRQTEEDSHGDRIISERQRESVFDCLSKMAQANEWAQMMKLDRNYRAFKTRDGKLACHVYQGKSYVKRLPMEVFMSYEYPRLRRRFMLCCPYLHVQSQAVAGANLNDTEVRMRRELELQNVLLSTIQLTHVLREQLDFLQRASIENPRTQLR